MTVRERRRSIDCADQASRRRASADLAGQRRPAALLFEMVAVVNGYVALKKGLRLITLILAIFVFLLVYGVLHRFVGLPITVINSPLHNVIIKTPLMRGSDTKTGKTKHEQSGNYAAKDDESMVENNLLEQNDEPEELSESGESKSVSVRDGKPPNTEDRPQDGDETKTVSTVKAKTGGDINPPPDHGNNELNTDSAKAKETISAKPQDDTSNHDDSVFCRLCEDLLGRNATWQLEETKNTESITPSGLHFPPSLVERAHKCGFVSGRRISPTEAMSTLNSVGPILFIGNSVFRRTMFAMTNLAMGDDKALVNSIATDVDLIERYGYQRIYDHKIHEGLLHVRLNVENITVEHIGFGDQHIPKLLLGQTSRNVDWGSDAVLTSVFMSTPPEYQARELVRACSGDPKHGKKFPSKLCANYNVLIIQLMKGIGRRRAPLLIEATAELMKQRPSLRVIFVGVAHAIGDSPESKMQKWLEKDVWPKVRSIGAEALDVTTSTYEAISSGKTQHEGTNLQHFMDQGRLLMASLILNRLRMAKCDG